MVYPGLVKAGLSFSMIILVSGGRYLSLAIVAGSTLAFIGWLHLCSTENQVAKTVWRGRNYSANPIKICLLYLLTIIAVGLQPSNYTFSF